MKQEIIAQGAEAIIHRNDKFVIKHRISKGYRHSELDRKIIKSRTKSEAKILIKASEIINCPKPLFVPDLDFSRIKMPFIDGKKLSDFLDVLKSKYKIMEQVGKETAKLHDNNIIHGDLTTSNMILVEGKNSKIKNINAKNNKLSDEQLINGKSAYNSVININREYNDTFRVFIIDFGLGFISPKIEDKAVDLHLIKQALEAKHFKFHKELFESFLKGYKTSKEADKVLEQLKKVEARGRYKH